MRKNGWKWLLVLVLAAVLALAAGGALAGWNDVTVATDGDGIAVYPSSGASKAVGILYNGYYAALSLEDENGRNSCWLAADYTVWLNQEKAENRQPDRSQYQSSDDWKAAMPCNIWLAEIAADDTPVYTSPKNKHIANRHMKGTLMTVCGEFGDDYYVEGPTYGFVAKSALRKVKDLTYVQVRSDDYGIETVQATVYASLTQPVYATSSATGYSEEANFRAYTKNEQVTVLRELGDWVQLRYGGFMEKRFLDPDGDHTYPTARVKTDGVTDRLIVHDSSVKLVSGVPVHVVSRTKEWAVIYLTGTNGGQLEYGKVKAEYLSFDEKATVRDGSVAVRLTRDLTGDKNGLSYGDSEKQNGIRLPADTPLKVIGVYSSGSSEADQQDRYLCETEDGQYIVVWSKGYLEPLNDSGVYAAARSAVKMRAEPSPDAKVLRQVKVKTKVEVLLRGEIWSLVKYKDETGYMMSRYLSFP